MCNSKEFFEKLAPAGFTFCRTSYTGDGEEYAVFKGPTTYYPDAGYNDPPYATRMALVRKDGSIVYENWGGPTAAQVNAILSAD